MSIVTTAELQAFMGLAAIPTGGADALDTAEALVAVFLGTDTLAVNAANTEDVTPPRNRDTIETTLSPVTTLTSVTYNSAADTVAGTTASKWIVKATNGFSSGVKYTINYASGWNTGSMPTSIKKAICAVAANVVNGGGQGTAGETVGDYSRSMNPMESSEMIPPVARELLAPWRRPDS